jgi:alkyl sulfatase BDS1-like metallo-beta-lactamase superfamily hydrolase
MTQDRSLPRTPLSSGVVVAFELTDTGESFHVVARRGVTTVASGRLDGAEATVRLPQSTWIALLLGLTSLGDALLADGVEAEGDLATFVRFHRRFHTTSPASLSRAGAERGLPAPAQPVEGEIP